MILIVENVEPVKREWQKYVALPDPDPQPTQEPAQAKADVIYTPEKMHEFFESSRWRSRFEKGLSWLVPDQGDWHFQFHRYNSQPYTKHGDRVSALTEELGLAPTLKTADAQIQKVINMQGGPHTSYFLQVPDDTPGKWAVIKLQLEDAAQAPVIIRRWLLEIIKWLNAAYPEQVLKLKLSNGSTVEEMESGWQTKAVEYKLRLQRVRVKEIPPGMDAVDFKQHKDGSFSLTPEGASGFYLRFQRLWEKSRAKYSKYADKGRQTAFNEIVQRIRPADIQNENNP